MEIEMHRSVLPCKVKQLIDCSCATTDDDSSVATEDSGLSSSETLNAQKVHFAMTASGHVQCKIRQIQRVKKPDDVWWQPQEDEEIRSQALDVLDSDPRYSLAGTIDRFLEREWRQGSKTSCNLLIQMLAAPEIRGLERHVSQRCKSMSADHVKRVLEVQKKTRNPALLSMVSKQTSMPFVQLATLKARVDSLNSTRPFSP
eukprot:scaffold6164_cov163-Amphora_coffeaeformis.AAC.13